MVLSKSFAAKSVGADFKSAIERKSVDIQTTSTLISNVATAVLLNGMTKGTNVYNRIGRKIVNVRIQLRGSIHPNGSAPATALPDFLRVAIVFDKQTNGAAPAWQDVFKVVDASGGTGVDARTFANLDNSDRFVILRDHKYQVPLVQIGGGPQQASATAESTENWIIDDFINMKLPTLYTGTANAGTVADIQSGGIFLLVQGMNSAANSSCNLIWDSRVRFVDG